jgi:hypothetical protein
MRIYATYARVEPNTWRLTSVSALSAERARALAEREQRRPGSEIRSAPLTVLEFDSMRAVPWHLPPAAV